MKEINSTQFIQLEPLEPFFAQAQHDYLTNQTMANKEIVFGINTQIFGGVTGSINCPTCVLREYKRLGELYFKYKENLENSTVVVDVNEDVKDPEEVDREINGTTESTSHCDSPETPTPDKTDELTAKRLENLAKAREAKKQKKELIDQK